MKAAGFEQEAVYFWRDEIIGGIPAVYLIHEPAWEQRRWNLCAAPTLAEILRVLPGSLADERLSLHRFARRHHGKTGLVDVLSHKGTFSFNYIAMNGDRLFPACWHANPAEAAALLWLRLYAEPVVEGQPAETA